MDSWPSQASYWFVVSLALAAPFLFWAQTQIPECCRALPRPEYRNLQRKEIRSSWFEVYQVAPAVFALYEPHQAEETISYLMVGRRRALLFDTGMGISDIRRVTAELTRLPIIVLNSHTHDDHVCPGSDTLIRKCWAIRKPSLFPLEALGR